MKKILSVLLTFVMAVSLVVSASADMFTLDPTDGEYWGTSYSTLDPDAVYLWYGDMAADYWASQIHIEESDTYQILEENAITNLEHGWYEAVLCNLGTNPENFDEADGKLAIVVRGDSTFTTKQMNASDAGAYGCIVCNNCRSLEAVDDEGYVTGNYDMTNMTVDHETLPTCIVSSDVGVRLVAACAGVTIKEAVDAVTAVFNGNTDLGLEGKNTINIFVGTLDEYKAAGEPAKAEEAEAEPETEPETEPEVVETAPETEPETEPEVVETAPETVETPAAETPAPQTFDIGVIAFAAAAAAAAGCTALKRKKK